MRMKTLVLVLIGTLVMEGLLVVGFAFTRSWWRAPNAVSLETIPPIKNVTDAEQVLKEKLDNYSKRADDLQKLLSLLLGLTTIYAIVLAVSAYTSVQNNIQLSEKAIARLDKLVEDHERVIPKELEQMRQETTYFGRIALATAASAFPLDSDDYKDVQESVIKGLVELRSGHYSIDPIINQRLARLYKALGRYRNAEEVMTGFIERKERRGEGDDPSVVDAYYDRACYQVFRLASASAPDKTSLIEAIEKDFSRAFTLDDTLKRNAPKDEWLRSVWTEDWFKNLVA